MESENSRKIKAELEQLLERTKKRGYLSRTEEWGPLNFNGLRVWLKQARRSWEELKNGDPDLIGAAQQQAIIETISKLHDAFKQMEQFTIKQGNPENARNAIGRLIIEAQDQFMAKTVGWLGYMMYLKGDIQGKMEEVEAASSRMEEGMKKRMEEVDSLRESEKRKMQTDAKEVEEIKNNIRESAQQIGVGTFSAEFEEQANTSREGAKAWLIATIGTTAGAMLTIWGIGWMTWLLKAETTWQMLGAGAAATGMMVFAAAWCGRMFKATKHQELTNRHRALSLKTVHAFSKASGNEEAREAILLGAAKCIFEGRTTGLTNERAEIPTTTTQIIETARKAAQGEGRA